MITNKIDWEEIIKKDIDQSVWNNFSDEQRQKFFSEAHKEELNYAKAIVVAMNTWLI